MSAYRLGVQEGRMMPLTLLFLLSLWTEVMDVANKREGRKATKYTGWWLVRE